MNSLSFVKKINDECDYCVLFLAGYCGKPRDLRSFQVGIRSL